TEQHVVAPGELAGLAHAGLLAVLVDQRDLGAGSDIESRLDGAAVAQRDTETGIGADQAVLTYADHLLAAAGECTQNAAATAEVTVGVHEHACGNTPFDHGRALGAGVEVAEAFVHQCRAFTDIG